MILAGVRTKTQALLPLPENKRRGINYGKDLFLVRFFRRKLEYQNEGFKRDNKMTVARNITWKLNVYVSKGSYPYVLLLESLNQKIYLVKNVMDYETVLTRSKLDSLSSKGIKYFINFLLFIP